MGAGEGGVDLTKALNVFTPGTNEMVVVGTGRDTASRQLAGVYHAGYGARIGSHNNCDFGWCEAENLTA